MIKAILFDCDGVLLDTERQYTEMWGSVGRELFPDVPDFALRVKGRTLVSIQQEWLGGDEALMARMRVMLDRLEASMRYDYVPGADRFLRQCRGAGLKTALVTSSNARKMGRVRAARPEFCDAFDTVVIAEDVLHSKPAPDGYLLAAERLGLRPAECAVCEDSTGGLQAARASGAHVVGVAGTIPRAELEALADVVIPDFEQLAPADLLARLEASKDAQAPGPLRA